MEHQATHYKVTLAFRTLVVGFIKRHRDKDVHILKGMNETLCESRT